METIIRCPEDNKRSFTTEANALLFEERNRAQYNDAHQYPYLCEHCNAWHLTSSPPGNHTIAKVDYDSLAIAAAGPNRKRRVETDEVVRLRESGKTLQEIADEYGIRMASVSYHLKKAEGTLTSKTSRPQLITYEHHRDRRIELENELSKTKRQHQGIEASMQAEVDRIKQIENRLFEARQLKIGYGPDGVVTLHKSDRQLDLSADDLKKLLAEIAPNAEAMPASVIP